MIWMQNYEIIHNYLPLLEDYFLPVLFPHIRILSILYALCVSNIIRLF